MRRVRPIFAGVCGAAAACSNSAARNRSMEVAVRVKTRWKNRQRPRSPEEAAGVLAFNIWRIACQGVLDIENEGFQTDTQRQRLDIIAEYLAFLVHLTDRMVYGRLDEEGRQRFVTALALRVIDILVDNLKDVCGPGEYRQEAIARMNERLADYAGYDYSEPEGPGFGFRRRFGELVQERVGPKDRRWVQAYVMDAGAPEAVETLRKAVRGVLAQLDAGAQQKAPDAAGTSGA